MSTRRRVALAIATGMLFGTAGGITWVQTHPTDQPVTAVWHEWSPLRCANHLATLPCQQGR